MHSRGYTKRPFLEFVGIAVLYFCCEPSEFSG